VPHEQSLSRAWRGDAELVQKAANGDTEAFVRLCIRFLPELRRFFAEQGVSPELCDELVQRISVSLWENRAHLLTKSSFQAYLFGMARNTLHKEMRRSRQISEKRRESRPGYIEKPYNALSQPEARLHSEELRDAIEKALEKLTEEQRQALETINSSEISFCCSSEKSKCSHEAHKGRLKRARKAMRQLLAHIFRDE
jgi:RNA polymerase sigma factor (sigma-70 family)